MKKIALVFIITASIILLLTVMMPEAEIEQPVHLISPDASSRLSLNSSSDTNTAAGTVSALNTTLPSSLQGTAHGITLVSQQDHFIVTASLTDLFEYYLSAAGEEGLDIIEARIIEDLSHQLNGQALAQALAIWRNYLIYKTALVEFDQRYQVDVTQLNQSQHLQFLLQRQGALIALQDEVFSSSVAEILFAFDRQLDHHTLAKAKLLTSELTPEQKQQSLINLNAQLPIEASLSMKRNEQQKTLLAIDEEQGLTAEQKYTRRAEHVGEAAANRLQQLDEQRQQWQQRLNNFKQQLNDLLAAGLAASDYQVSLEKLYQQHFSPAEQLRAKALTSVSAQ